MHLTQREQERLLIFTAAEVARRRRTRGLQLNYPEALAILTAEILEWARDGKTVAEIMTLGTRILTADDVRGLSIIQLQYAIDEVYARYGATFPHRADNQREFEKFSWYHANPNLSYEAIDQLVSVVERQNIKFLALCRELKRGK